ncbi:MAG: hypothetical protein HQL24_08290 [Candidatus Omnitrophica bacterium]|nr:hypothetical protein [Candidatus Omnitrophota bacterium]
MKKYLFLAFIFLLICGISFAGQVSLTTYYPAPFANYSQIRLVPNSSQPTCDSNHIGVLYVNTSGELQYCSSGGWSQQSAIWNLHANSQNSGMHVISPLNDVGGLQVGLGAANPTPGVKLQIGGDANGFLEGEGPVSGLLGGTAVLIRPAGFFRDVYLALAAYGNDSSSHTAGITFGTTNNPVYSYIRYNYQGTKDTFEEGKLLFSAKGNKGDSMVLDSNGGLGIGIGGATPHAKLVVKGPVAIGSDEEVSPYEFNDVNGDIAQADLSVNGIAYLGNATIGGEPYEFTDEYGSQEMASLSVNGVAYFGNEVIINAPVRLVPNTNSVEPTCDSNHIGTLYVNGSGNLLYCASSGWVQQSSFWLQMYPPESHMMAPTDYTNHITLNNQDLYFRPEPNHGIGYYSTWNGSALNGPVLYGWDAGALGTVGNGTPNKTQNPLALYWNREGNVGIGKTNPTTALDVNGDIKASGLLGGAGYVCVDDAGKLYRKTGSCP